MGHFVLETCEIYGGKSEDKNTKGNGNGNDFADAIIILTMYLDNPRNTKMTSLLQPEYSKTSLDLHHKDNTVGVSFPNDKVDIVTAY